MPTILLWTTARIHPRLTALLFNLMRTRLANAPKDQLPASEKKAMMAETDFECTTTSNFSSAAYLFIKFKAWRNFATAVRRFDLRKKLDSAPGERRHLGDLIFGFVFISRKEFK